MTQCFDLARPTGQSGDGLFLFVVFEDFIAQSNQRNDKHTKTQNRLYNFKSCQRIGSSFPSDFDELPIGITSLSESGATVFTFLQDYYTIFIPKLGSTSEVFLTLLRNPKIFLPRMVRRFFDYLVFLRLPVYPRPANRLRPMKPNKELFSPVFGKELFLVTRE